MPVRHFSGILVVLAPDDCLVLRLIPVVYHGQDVVKMWVFSKNTIAGDLGVTPIVQCLASMLITSTLVHSDLHHSAVKPLPYVYPHVDHLPDPRLLLSPSFRREQQTSAPLGKEAGSEKDTAAISAHEKKGISYYYWKLVRFIFEGTERNMLLAKPGLANWFGRVLWTAAQGAGIGIIFGFPIWCLAIVILGPIYGNGNLGNKWAPQVIKLVYGAIVGWITNPVIAVLALGSQADHHLIVVDVDEEQGQGQHEPRAQEVQGAAGVETIPEEENDGDLTTGIAHTTSPLPSPRVPSSPLASSRMRTRPRASSSASSFSLRPPLTANVSHLSPLPAASVPLPSDVDAAATPPRPAYGRERGMTVSSTGSGYSYALRGTGGRAQRTRPRANTGVPDVVVSTADSSENEKIAGGRPRAGSLDVFGRRVTAPSTPSRSSPTATSPRTNTRTRSASTLAALGETRESRDLDRR